jgi:predicted phage tail protein
MEDKLYSVTLHGSLGGQFTEETIKIYANSVKDVFTGLCMRFGDEFKQTILDGSWHICQGALENEDYISPDFVDFPCDQELHVFPAITGAGGRGIGQIILGVILIIISIVIIVVTWGSATPGVIAADTAYFGGLSAVSFGLAGAAALAGGVMAMMAKSPTASFGSNSSAANNPSFIFSGAVNTVTQGGPVPLVYGIHPTGSTVISAGISVKTS